MSTSQCAVYQVKDTPEYRDVRFRSYEKLKSEGKTVQIENYHQVYIGRIQPGETPADIKTRLQKQRPKNFKGHSIGCSDDLDSFFPTFYMAVKFLLPCLIPCHQCCFRFLHGDQKGVIKTVIMELGHGIQIFCISLRSKDFFYSLLQPFRYFF